jgi:hypothetical protein
MTAFRALLLLVALVAAGCASVPSLDGGPDRSSRPALRFGVDTFAFANESRAHNPGKPDLYANYCFVMARAITQFRRFARFEPTVPKVAADRYEELVHDVVSRAPWEDPPPVERRVAIPGYPSLYALSREQERAVKAGLGSRFWTLVHWTNWRVVFPMPGFEQERVAREVRAELAAGRPAQLLVANLPSWELNHTVVAYQYRIGDNGDVEFQVYDPNDPRSPGVITFDRAGQQFLATRLWDTNPGVIRAFRMYYSPLL